MKKIAKTVPVTTARVYNLNEETMELSILGTLQYTGNVKKRDLEKMVIESLELPKDAQPIIKTTLSFETYEMDIQTFIDNATLKPETVAESED